MKHSVFFISILVANAMSPAFAENADRDKPMNAEADALRYDDLKQTSVFTGNVVITKGSTIIRGAQVDVKQDPEGYQQAVVVGAPGKLAFYRKSAKGLMNSSKVRPSVLNTTAVWMWLSSFAVPCLSATKELWWPMKQRACRSITTTKQMCLPSMVAHKTALLLTRRAGCALCCRPGRLLGDQIPCPPHPVRRLPCCAPAPRLAQTRNNRHGL